MTIQKPRTLQELVRMKGIKLKEFKGIIAKQTYYNMISGKYSPTERTIKKIADLLEIEPKYLKKLLKNSLK